MPSFIDTGTKNRQQFGDFGIVPRLTCLLSCLLFRPDMVDMTRVSAQTNRSNLEQAFTVAEQLGVARLLDPEGETPARSKS